jgi:hypothetical protein
LTLEKIISGGQTGVDRGALDAALAAGFACGGSCPADRAAEDGTIPLSYPLTPLPGAGYRERTLRNVLDSDGSVIFAPGALTGGTRLTREYCGREAKPHLVIDVSRTNQSEAVSAIRRFIAEQRIRILNVAGPRASLWTAGHAYASEVIRRLLESLEPPPGVTG